MANPGQIAALGQTLTGAGGGQADAAPVAPMVPTPASGTAVATPTTGNPVMDQIVGQMQSQQGVISSADQTLNDQYAAAIKELGASQTASESAIRSEYAPKFASQEVTGAQATEKGMDVTHGIGLNAGLLMQIDTQNKSDMANLEDQMNVAIQTGRAETASKISDLMVAQATATLANKQKVLDNMATIAGVATQAQNTQIEQAKLAEQQQNDVVTLATKYGVPVKPGETMEDLVNNPTLQARASTQEQLTVAGMRADVNAKNAEASLAAAQASSITPLTDTQASTLFTNYLNQVPGTDAQKNALAMMSAAVSANPKNALVIAKIQNNAAGQVIQTTMPNGTINPTLITWAKMAQNNGLTVDQAIQQYVTNNPYVGNKSDVSQIFYALYGVDPSVNPFAQAMNEMSIRFGVNVNPLLSLTGGAKGTGGALSPSVKTVFQTGAQQFAAKNPGTNAIPGANPYVVQLTGSTTKTYEQYLKESHPTAASAQQ